MSTFSCPVVKVKIEPHPNADKIEIARVGDYQSIVGKDQFKDGDLAVYIPEQAIVPENVLDTMGLKGKLSGAYKNRVKAVKLRGVLSQGILYPAPPGAVEGEDHASLLGIIKYDPPIPKELQGEVFGYHDFAFKFDIEDWKKYPHIFESGEHVVYSEKLHGSFGFYGKVVTGEGNGEAFDDKYLLGSKGRIAQGLFFKKTVDNTYTKVFMEFNIRKLLDHFETLFPHSKMVFVVGEVLGVQGGFPYGNQKFRMFGVGAVLADGKRIWTDFVRMTQFAQEFEIPHVPVLGHGQFHPLTMKGMANGKETVSGDAQHMREGLVIYPYNEGSHPEIGRKVLKYVGEEYLGQSTGEEVA